MNFGVLAYITNDLDEYFGLLKKHGFTSCQLNTWDPEELSDERAEAVNAASKKHDIEISGLWCGWQGPAEWNFTNGPLTLGLVPAAYRHARIEHLKKARDFAVKIGVTDIITHMGFLPETPNTAEYQELVAAIKYLANYYKEKDRYLLFETGQETPVTLLRTIEMVGTGNLGINLDTANLILYGKANPVDALDVFGKYVRNTHIKDGFYPTDGIHLGKEVPVGQGKVNFPELIKKFREIGYDGPLTIEREISGDEQIKDILATKKYLENLL